MRRVGLGVSALALVWMAGAATAQRTAGPPVRRVTVGAIEVALFGQDEPTRTPSRSGERVSLVFENISQTLVRGSEAALAAVRQGRTGDVTVRDHRTRACGRPAVRRERIVLFEEMSSWWADGQNEHIRTPGPAEVILAFDHAGEHYAVVWGLSDHRRRGRHRALERRFFASISCR